VGTLGVRIRRTPIRTLACRRVDLALELLGVGVQFPSISLTARVFAFSSCSSIFDSPITIMAPAGQLRPSTSGTFPPLKTSSKRPGTR
jgi:hypothetical protein